MAKVVSQNIVISINKLVKGDSDSKDDDNQNFINSDIITQLEAVVQELVNDDTLVVEVFKS